MAMEREKERSQAKELSKNEGEQKKSTRRAKRGEKSLAEEEKVEGDPQRDYQSKRGESNLLLNNDKLLVFLVGRVGGRRVTRASFSSLRLGVSVLLI